MPSCCLGHFQMSLSSEIIEGDSSQVFSIENSDHLGLSWEFIYVKREIFIYYQINNCMTALLTINREDLTIESCGLVVSILCYRRKESSPDNTALRGRGVLCVHGLATNRHFFDQMALNLLESASSSSTEGPIEVATFDLRGHGDSCDVQGPYTQAQYAADIDTVLAFLREERGEAVWGKEDYLPSSSSSSSTSEGITLLGHSYGGNICLTWLAHKAAQNAQRGVATASPPELSESPAHLSGVKRLVLCDGGFIDLPRHFADAASCRTSLLPPPTPPSQDIRFQDLPMVLVSWFPAFSSGAINAFMCNFRRDEEKGTAALRLSVEAHTEILDDLYIHSPSELLRRMPGGARQPLTLSPPPAHTPLSAT